jgi:hypothetical protein
VERAWVVVERNLLHSLNVFGSKIGELVNLSIKVVYYCRENSCVRVVGVVCKAGRAAEVEALDVVGGFIDEEVEGEDVGAGVYQW